MIHIKQRRRTATANATPTAARDVACRAASFEALCRARGVRVTAQRLAVFRALAADAAHPTAEDIHARLDGDWPGLSLPSVYRILESLGRQGLIKRVSTTGGRARFDANLDPHQHLVCRQCGAMTDFTSPELMPPLPPLPALPARLAVEGFEVEDLDVRLIGRCASCRRAGGRSAKHPTHPRLETEHA